MGKVDCYIDDKIAIGLDLPGMIPRLEACITTALHIFFRPIAPSEPLPRNDAAATAKLVAEGGLEEEKLFLGWSYNTRTLTISLPDHKHTAWSRDLETLVHTKTTSAPTLESLIGRLNHVGFLIPSARRFLSRIRHLHRRTKFKRQINILKLVIDDFILWREFLSQANEGISMNLLTFRKPTHIFRADACEHGLGGFSEEGHAWRWEIPQHLRGRAHINLLEFIASVVCIWLDSTLDLIPEESCLLSMGDSTTATGWMRKSNFQPEGDSDTDTTAKLQVARLLARISLKHKACLYSQWFPGKDNALADSLSRDHHLSPHELTSLVSRKIPQQLPRHFRIVPIPREVGSWICSLLAKMPEQKDRHKPQRMSDIAAGTDGTDYCRKSIYPTTHSSPPSPTNPIKPPSSALSHKQFAKPRTPPPTSTDWPKGQSEPPSTTWHRPSGLVTNRTHASTPRDAWLSFCRRNSKGIKT